MTPAHGSVVITRSMTAARKTERTTTNLVLMVVAARRLLWSFTHSSMCERRMLRIARSAKGTDRVARSALVLVEDTQSCRADQRS